MLISILKSFGFTEKESKIYLTCLQLGSSPASTIARYSNEKRVTTYTVLKELIKKGIANEIIREKVKYYSVIKPEDIIKNQEQKLNNLKDHLPEFSKLIKNNIMKPKASFYDGIEGLKRIYDDIMYFIKENSEKLKKEPILSFLGTANLDKKFQEWLSKDFTKRDFIQMKKYNLSRKCTKVIIFDENTDYARLNKKIYDTKTISNPLFDTSNEIIVYGETKVTILMFDTEEMSGLVIESKTLNKTLRNLFDLIRNNKL